MTALQRPLAFVTLLGALALLAGCKPDYPKCKEDSHCAEHGEVCVEGLCKECSTDKECKEGFTCKQNACVPLPQCRLDADCSGGLRCRGAMCVPECTSDRECASSEKCSQNKCIPAPECSVDGDCATGKSCRNEKCVAVETSDAGTSSTGGVDDEATRKRKLMEACTLTRVEFEFNEYALSDGARAMLDKNADCIRYKGRAVTIEGHADERGTEEYNIVLGEKRANAAKRYIVGLGIDEAKLKTVSFGEEKPIDQGHDEAAWAHNRRAEFSFR